VAFEIRDARDEFHHSLAGFRLVDSVDDPVYSSVHSDGGEYKREQLLPDRRRACIGELNSRPCQADQGLTDPVTVFGNLESSLVYKRTKHVTRRPFLALPVLEIEIRTVMARLKETFNNNEQIVDFPLPGGACAQRTRRDLERSQSTTSLLAETFASFLLP
jgi:hypothetical protein